MAETQGGAASGFRAGAIYRTVKLVLFISIIVLAAQLYLNPADRRAQVMCLPVYKAAHLFMVTVPRYFLPRDSEFVIRNINRTERLYFSCLGYADRLPGVDRQ